MFRGLFRTKPAYQKLTTYDTVEPNNNNLSEEEDYEVDSPETVNGILLKRITNLQTSSTDAQQRSSVEIEYYEIPVNLSQHQNLHSVALKYNCSIWELKRCNNFHTTQDYFASRSLRIPAVRNSFRAELLKRDGGQLCAHPHCLDPSAASDSCTIQMEGDQDPTSSISPIPPSPLPSCPQTNPGEDAASSNGSLSSIRRISIRDHFFAASSGHAEDRLSGTQFLRALDRDLQRIRQTVTPMKASMSHAVDSLLAPRILPLVAIPSPLYSTSNTDRRSFNAAHLATSPSVAREFYCGLSIQWLLVVLLGLLVLLPLAIVLIKWASKLPSVSP